MREITEAVGQVSLEGHPHQHSSDNAVIDIDLFSQLCLQREGALNPELPGSRGQVELSSGCLAALVTSQIRH